MSAPRITIFLALLLGSAACGSDSAVSDPAGSDPKPDAASGASGAAVTPGSGVRAADKDLLLGATLSSLREGFGDPSDKRDMGALGLRISYPYLHLSAMLVGSGDGAVVRSITAHPGFDEGAAEKRWLGATEEAVEAELGEPVRDPFLGGWWYRGRGIAFEMKDGAVAGLTVFAPNE